jgi:hypothetical protein
MSEIPKNAVVFAENMAANRAQARWIRPILSLCHNWRSQAVRAAGRTAVAFLLALAVSSGVVAAGEPQASGTISSKVWRHAQRWVERHDTDGDGRLKESEWPTVDGVGAVDANRDTIVTVDELAQHIADFGTHRKIRLMPAGAGGVVPLPSLLPPSFAGAGRQAVLEGANAAESADETEGPDDLGEHKTPDRSGQRKYFVPASRLPTGLPDWFRKADHDGDGQLTFAEYAELGSPSADKEFARYDRNQDGLITPGEVLDGGKRVQRPVRPDPAAKAKTTREISPSETSH